MRAEPSGDFLNGRDATEEDLVDPDADEGASPIWVLAASELPREHFEFPSASGVAQGAGHDVAFGAGFAEDAGTAHDGFFGCFGAQPSARPPAPAILIARKETPGGPRHRTRSTPRMIAP